MRQTLLRFTVLSLFLASASDVLADDTIQGVVFKVHLPVIMFNVAAPKGERHFQCLTNAKTQVTINGKDAKVTDLGQGMICQITYGGGNTLASKIEAVTQKPGGS